MKKGLTFLFILALALFEAQALADTRSLAVSAVERGDYAQALGLWRTLADAGDATAQYNIALFYQRGLGVARNEAEARRWFRAAAEHGLVQAYRQLNGAGVKPNPVPRPAVQLAMHGGSGVLPSPASVPASMPVAFDSEAETWVFKQKPAYYTLQLASSRNRALIEKYYEENNLKGKAGFYRSMREGQEWFALVYGAFPSVSDARAEITNLPPELQKWSPWVRNIRDIHKIMLRRSAQAGL